MIEDCEQNLGTESTAHARPIPSWRRKSAVGRAHHPPQVSPPMKRALIGCPRRCRLGACSEGKVDAGAKATGYQASPTFILGQSRGRRPEGAVGAADRDAHAQPERIHAHAMNSWPQHRSPCFPPSPAPERGRRSGRSGRAPADAAAQQRAVWREVRSGVPGETAVIGRETNSSSSPP